MANMVAAGEAMDRVVLVPGETPRVRNFEYHETTPGYFGGRFDHFRPKWWRRENLALEAKFSVGVREMGSWKGKWNQKFAKRIFTSSKNGFLNFIYI
jgi:hypothetical protein